MGIWKKISTAYFAGEIFFPEWALKCRDGTRMEENENEKKVSKRNYDNCIVCRYAGGVRE